MYTVQIKQGLEQLEEARGIRTHVFVQEQGFNNEFDDIDQRAYHIVVYDDGLPIATGRTYQKEDNVYALGRIAVEKAYRGKQIGRLVIMELEAKLKELGVEQAVLSAQTAVKGFYETLGYQAEGEEYLDEHCPHINMRKKLRKCE